MSVHHPKGLFQAFSSQYFHQSPMGNLLLRTESTTLARTGLESLGRLFYYLHLKSRAGTTLRPAVFAGSMPGPTLHPLSHRHIPLACSAIHTAGSPFPESSVTFSSINHSCPCPPPPRHCRTWRSLIRSLISPTAHFSSQRPIVSLLCN